MTLDLNLLSVSVMRHLLPIIILSFCLVSLTGCDLLEVIRKSAGTYEGKTANGLACKIEIRTLFTPTGLCRWVGIILTTEETLVGHEESKRFCVGTSEMYAPTEFKITKGDSNHPQQINIQDEMLIDIKDQRPSAVLFLDSKSSCQQLELK